MGASARAAAQSAVRSGYRPWCIDLFGDRDLQQIAAVRRCVGRAYPHGILALLETAPIAPVLYTGALENAPEVLDAIALQRPILGCSPDAVRQVRHPLALASMPPQPGLRICKTRLRRPLTAFLLKRFGRRYLVKPRSSAGGMHIEHWRPATRIGRNRYLQQFIRGKPISSVHMSDGWSARLLGVTEQLIGDPRFGSRPRFTPRPRFGPRFGPRFTPRPRFGPCFTSGGFSYCGSIGPLKLSPIQHRVLVHLGVSLAQQFDLRGLFGIDAVIDHRGNIWPVEVNPRYTASVEILERATGISALDSTLPARSVTVAGEIWGKAIVFARDDVTAPDLYDWFDDEQIADVPPIGRRIDAGQPICTLLAHGLDRDSCLTHLHDMAATLYTHLR